MIDEEEKRRRIQVALWAYAYEIENHPLVPDHVFDVTCLEINPNTSTGNEVLDKFFRTEFDPCTGNWIHKHPELDKVKLLYKRVAGYLAEEVSNDSQTEDRPVQMLEV